MRDNIDVIFATVNNVIESVISRLECFQPVQATLPWQHKYSVIARAIAVVNRIQINGECHSIVHVKQMCHRGS